MGNALELIGQRFGRLTVVNRNPTNTLSESTRWDCVCDCGNKITTVAGNLTKGDTRSCGCYRKERMIETHVIHGMSKTPEYNTWRAMIRRCTEQNHIAYSYYGGRGITVCDRWLNSFEAFYEDMGPRPSLNYTLDRKENDLGYYKENCRWITRKEQSNNLRNNVFYEYRGNKYSIKQLSELPESIENNVCIDTLTTRLYRSKWSVEESLNTPVKVRCAPIYVYNDTTKTILEWSMEYNIDYNKLYNRLLRMKWDFYRAINTP